MTGGLSEAQVDALLVDVSAVFFYSELEIQDNPLTMICRSSMQRRMITRVIVMM